MRIKKLKIDISTARLTLHAQIKSHLVFGDERDCKRLELQLFKNADRDNIFSMDASHRIFPYMALVTQLYFVTGDLISKANIYLIACLHHNDTAV